MDDRGESVSKRRVRSFPRGVRQLERYHGWDMHKMFENIYAKISVIKAVINIKDNKQPLRLGMRLRNIFKLLVMLSNHIGQK